MAVLELPEIRSLDQWRRVFVELSELIARNAAERVDAEVTGPREGLLTIHIARPIVNDYSYRPLNNALRMAQTVSRAIGQRRATYEQINLPYIRDAQYDLYAAGPGSATSAVDRAIFRLVHTANYRLLEREAGELAVGALSAGFTDQWRELYRRYSEPGSEGPGPELDRQLARFFSSEPDAARAWFDRAFRSIE